MRCTLLGVVVAAGSLAFAPTANAQEPQGAQGSFDVGVSAGLSIPTGDFGDAVSAGYNLAFLLGYRPVTLPMRLRGELMLHSFDFEQGDGDVRTIAGVGNVMFSLSSEAEVQPYIIGGLGLYNLDPDGGDSSTDIGLNAGFGIEFTLAGFSTFLEGRLHSVFTEGDNTNFVPLSFGIVF